MNVQPWDDQLRMQLTSRPEQANTIFALDVGIHETIVDRSVCLSCKAVPQACLRPQDRLCVPTFAYIYHVQRQPPHESLNLFTEKDIFKKIRSFEVEDSLDATTWLMRRATRQSPFPKMECVEKTIAGH